MSRTSLRALTAIAAAVLVVGVQAGAAQAADKDHCTFGWPGMGEHCSEGVGPIRLLGSLFEDLPR